MLTALALVTLTVNGFVMWRRRKPEATLGAPPLPSVPARIGVAIIMLMLAVLLPLLALSLLGIALVERLVLSRIPRVRDWLGLRTSSATVYRPRKAGG